MTNPKSLLRKNDFFTLEDWEKVVSALKKVDRDPGAYLQNFERCECPNCEKVGIFKVKLFSKHVHPECGFVWYSTVPQYLFDYFLYDPFVNGFRSAGHLAFVKNEKDNIFVQIFTFIFTFLFFVVFALLFKIAFFPLLFPLFLIFSNGKKVPMVRRKIDKDNYDQQE